MDRKTFIRKTTAGILLAIPAISLIGCSGSDDGGDPNPNPNPDPNPDQANCLENGTNSSVGSAAGHSHSFTVPKEDVQAGEEKTYVMSNVNAHTHQVTITAAQFATLQGNNSITATSTSDSGHTHSVSVSCA